jgi:hypothetical protein
MRTWTTRQQSTPTPPPATEEAIATELQGLGDDDLQDLAHFFANLPRP